MKIILLGGVPGVGKTTISNYLAIKYNISTTINIDVIKSTLKLFIDPNEKYLYTTSHNASKVENLSIIKAYLKHSNTVNKYIKDYYRLFLLTNKKYYIFNNIFFYISSLNIVSCLVSLLIVYRLIYYINKLLKIVLEFDIKILYMNYSYLIISLILIFIYTLVISIVKSNKLVKSYYNKLN